MKEHEAIELIKQTPLMRYKEINPAMAGCELADALTMAIEALEKQIPKKPNEVEKIMNNCIGKCPSCGMSVVCHTHCQKCGQKLDWSES